MSSPEEARRPLSDFIKILASQEWPLIGGQAVNLWATSYQEQCPELKRFQPFVSKDCDVIGDCDTLSRLGDIVGVKPQRTEEGAASPVVGVVVICTAEGEELLIEVLYRARGMDRRDANKIIKVNFNGAILCTYSPILLLKLKIANATELPQEKRQDVRHIEILVRCIPQYICAAISDFQSGRALTERGLVNILGECLQIVSTRAAYQVAEMHGIDFSACFPKILGTLKIPKVVRFWNEAFARRFPRF